MHIFPFQRTVKKKIRNHNVKSDLAKTGWKFSPSRLKMIQEEEAIWQQYYLPVDVSNKTVLDIGAGEGETAWFYLKHGAKKVVCVEPEKEAYNRLLGNAVGKPMEAINRIFRLDDLNLKYDFLKVDIEGYEEALLNVELKKPAIIEVHGLQLRDRFKLKNYRILYPTVADANGMGCICFAYWQC
jgi:hypothetical protein